MPELFEAIIVNEYAVPEVNPLIVADVAEPGTSVLIIAPPSEVVITLYVVMIPVGAVKENAMDEASLATKVNAVGAAGDNP